MNRHVAAVAIVALSFTTFTAHAEPSKDTPQHAERLLPVFKLDAASTGKAKFKVGLGYTHALREFVDITVDGVYQTTTDEGVSQLFNFGEENVTTPDYQLGGALTISWLRPFVGVTVQKSELNQRAFARCLATCTGPAIAEKNKAFCATAKAVGAKLTAPITDLDPTKLSEDQMYDLRDADGYDVDYCPDGGEVVATYKPPARDIAAVIPQMIASAGVLVGSTQSKFLVSDAADPMQLRPDDKRDNTFTGILTAVYVTDDLISLEVNAKFQSKVTPGSQKAKWCIPGGTVADGGVMVPAEICDERPIGEPKRARVSELAVYGGTVSNSRSMRLSLGLFTSKEPTDNAADRRVYGLRIPLIFSTDILPGRGIYKGVLRFTPTLSFVENPAKDENDTRFFVTLEVFGSRSLFGSAIDVF